MPFNPQDIINQNIKEASNQLTAFRSGGQQGLNDYYDRKLNVSRNEELRKLEYARKTGVEKNADGSLKQDSDMLIRAKQGLGAVTKFWNKANDYLPGNDKLLDIDYNPTAMLQGKRESLNNKDVFGARSTNLDAIRNEIVNAKEDPNGQHVFYGFKYRDGYNPDGTDKWLYKYGVDKVSATNRYAGQQNIGKDFQLIFEKRMTGAEDAEHILHALPEAMKYRAIDTGRDKASGVNFGSGSTELYTKDILGLDKGTEQQYQQNAEKSSQRALKEYSRTGTANPLKALGVGTMGLAADIADTALDIVTPAGLPKGWLGSDGKGNNTFFDSAKETGHFDKMFGYDRTKGERALAEATAKAKKGNYVEGVMDFVTNPAAISVTAESLPYTVALMVGGLEVGAAKGVSALMSGASKARKVGDIAKATELEAAAAQQVKNLSTQTKALNNFSKNAGLYTVSAASANSMIDERIKNNGGEPVSMSEVAATMGTSVLMNSIDRFAFKNIIGLDGAQTQLRNAFSLAGPIGQSKVLSGIGRSVAAMGEEGATEYVQTWMEILGGQLGTKDKQSFMKVIGDAANQEQALSASIAGAAGGAHINTLSQVPENIARVKNATVDFLTDRKGREAESLATKQNTHSMISPTRMEVGSGVDLKTHYETIDRTLTDTKNGVSAVFAAMASTGKNMPSVDGKEEIDLPSAIKNTIESIYDHEAMRDGGTPANDYVLDKRVSDRMINVVKQGLYAIESNPDLTPEQISMAKSTLMSNANKALKMSRRGDYSQPQQSGSSDTQETLGSIKEPDDVVSAYARSAYDDLNRSISIVGKDKKGMVSKESAVKFVSAIETLGSLQIDDGDIPVIDESVIKLYDEISALLANDNTEDENIFVSPDAVEVSNQISTKGFIRNGSVVGNLVGLDKHVSNIKSAIDALAEQGPDADGYSAAKKKLDKAVSDFARFASGRTKRSGDIEDAYNKAINGKSEDDLNRIQAEIDVVSKTFEQDNSKQYVAEKYRFTKNDVYNDTDEFKSLSSFMQKSIRDGIKENENFSREMWIAKRTDIDRDKDSDNATSELAVGYSPRRDASGKIAKAKINESIMFKKAIEDIASHINFSTMLDADKEPFVNGLKELDSRQDSDIVTIKKHFATAYGYHLSKELKFRKEQTRQAKISNVINSKSGFKDGLSFAAEIAVDSKNEINGSVKNTILEAYDLQNDQQNIKMEETANDVSTSTTTSEGNEQGTVNVETVADQQDTSIGIADETQDGQGNVESSTIDENVNAVVEPAVGSTIPDNELDRIDYEQYVEKNKDQQSKIVKTPDIKTPGSTDDEKDLLFGKYTDEEIDAMDVKTLDAIIYQFESMLDIKDEKFNVNAVVEKAKKVFEIRKENLPSIKSIMTKIKTMKTIVKQFKDKASILKEELDIAKVDLNMAKLAGDNVADIGTQAVEDISSEISDADAAIEKYSKDIDTEKNKIEKVKKAKEKTKGDLTKKAIAGSIDKLKSMLKIEISEESKIKIKAKISELEKSVAEKIYNKKEANNQQEPTTGNSILDDDNAKAYDKKLKIEAIQASRIYGKVMKKLGKDSGSQELLEAKFAMIQAKQRLSNHKVILEILAEEEIIATNNVNKSYGSRKLPSYIAAYLNMSESMKGSVKVSKLSPENKAEIIGENISAEEAIFKLVEIKGDDFAKKVFGEDSKTMTPYLVKIAAAIDSVNSKITKDNSFNMSRDTKKFVDGKSVAGSSVFGAEFNYGNVKYLTKDGTEAGNNGTIAALLINNNTTTSREVMRIIDTNLVAAMEGMYKVLYAKQDGTDAERFDAMWGLSGLSEKEYAAGKKIVLEAIKNGQIPRSVVVRGIGSDIYNALPIKLTGDVDAELKEEAIAQLGMFAIERAANIKLIVEVGSAIEIGSKSNNQVLIKLKTGDEVANILTASSAMQYLGLAEKRDMPSFEPITALPDTQKNGKTALSEEDKRQLLDHQSTPFSFKPEMEVIHAVWNKNKEKAYKLAGILDVDNDLHVSKQRIEQVKNRNAQLRFDDMMNFYEQAKNEGKSEFYVPWTMATNQRHMIDSVINYQEDKVLRFLVTASGLKETVRTKQVSRKKKNRYVFADDQQLKMMKLSIAQSLELGPDKKIDDSVLDELDKILTIDEEMNIKFSTNENVSEKTKKMRENLEIAVDSVKIANGEVSGFEDDDKSVNARAYVMQHGEKMHAFQTIVELARMDASSIEGFETRLTIEADDITSGSAIMALQIGSEEALKFAAKAGIYTKDMQDMYRDLHGILKDNNIISTDSILGKANFDVLSHGKLLELGKVIDELASNADRSDAENKAYEIIFKKYGDVRELVFNDVYNTIAQGVKHEIKKEKRNLISNISKMLSDGRYGSSGYYDINTKTTIQILQSLRNRKIKSLEMLQYIHDKAEESGKKPNEKDVKEHEDMAMFADLMSKKLKLIELVGTVSRNTAKPSVMTFNYGSLINTIKKNLMYSLLQENVYDLASKEVTNNDEDERTKIAIARAMLRELLDGIYAADNGTMKLQKGDSNVLYGNMVIDEDKMFKVYKQAMDQTFGKAFEESFKQFNFIERYRGEIKTLELVRFEMYDRAYKIERQKIIDSRPEGYNKLTSNEEKSIVDILEAKGIGHSVKTDKNGQLELYKTDRGVSKRTTQMSVFGKDTKYSSTMEKINVANAGAAPVTSTQMVDKKQIAATVEGKAVQQVYDASVASPLMMVELQKLGNKVIIEQANEVNTMWWHVSDIANRLEVMKKEYGDDVIDKIVEGLDDKHVENVVGVLTTIGVPKENVESGIIAFLQTVDYGVRQNIKNKSSGSTDIASAHFYVTDAEDNVSGTINNATYKDSDKVLNNAFNAIHVILSSVGRKHTEMKKREEEKLVYVSVVNEKAHDDFVEEFLSTISDTKIRESVREVFTNNCKK